MERDKLIDELMERVSVFIAEVENEKGNSTCQKTLDTLQKQAQDIFDYLNEHKENWLYREFHKRFLKMAELMQNTLECNEELFHLSAYIGGIKEDLQKVINMNK
jgi:hypothetical protein